MKKNLEITLKIEDLRIDILNKAYLVGRSRKSGDGSGDAQISYMQASEGEEDKEQLIRSLTSAFQSLRNKVAEFLVETGTTSTNELVADDQDLKISLNLPNNYNESTRDNIASGFHGYLVNSVLSEWFSITKPDEKAYYESKAVEYINEAMSAIYKRTYPKRSTV